MRPPSAITGAACQVSRMKRRVPGAGNRETALGYPSFLLSVVMVWLGSGATMAGAEPSSL